MKEVYKIMKYKGKLYNKFEISNFGNLRNSKTKHIYKLQTNKHGYKVLYIYCTEASKKYLSIVIHQAVAENFVPNPFNKPIINHKDGNKSNNYYLNLEWDTYQGNNQHAYDQGLNKGHKNATGVRSLTTEQAKEIIRKYNHNAPTLAKQYNVCTQTILNIIHGKYYKNIGE